MQASCTISMTVESQGRSRKMVNGQFPKYSESRTPVETIIKLGYYFLNFVSAFCAIN